MYVATASPRPKRSALDSSRGGNVPCVLPPFDPPLPLMCKVETLVKREKFNISFCLLSLAVSDLQRGRGRSGVAYRN